MILMGNQNKGKYVVFHLGNYNSPNAESPHLSFMKSLMLVWVEAHSWCMHIQGVWCEF